MKFKYRFQPCVPMALLIFGFISISCKSMGPNQVEDMSPSEADEMIAAELAQDGYSIGPEEEGDYSISDYKAFDPRGILIPFAFDEASLQTDTELALRKIVAGMKKDPLSQIVVQGHSDKQGSRSHNFRLSRERARVITEYLVQHGIEEERIEQAAFGASAPLERGNTVRVYKKNRRGDFQVSYGRNVFGK